jgi:O-antigen/teichoic acid export membrane protein
MLRMSLPTKESSDEEWEIENGCNFIRTMEKTQSSSSTFPNFAQGPAASDPSHDELNPEAFVNTSGSETLNVLAQRGMRQLFVRQIFTTAITLVGGILLARALSPSEFGIYAIATFIVNVFMVFGDLGLGPAFVQSASAPSHQDLQISFTMQFCLITTAVVLTWSLAPWIMGFYPEMGQEGLRLARVLSLLLYLPIFRSMSEVLLERSLNFKPIAWAEGIGMSLYQIVAATCALSGLGVWSFVLATFVAGISSCVVLYFAAPWPIRLRFDLTEMQRVLKRGIAFQSVSVVHLISQWATPAIVGVLVGPAAVGYLGLALANARRPLLVAESIIRVSFPHFSRLQNDIQTFHDTIRDYLLGFLWVMVLWTGFLWTSASPLVAFAYSPKWLPVVPALIIFAAALPADIIIWTMVLCYRATDRNWSALKIFALRTAFSLALGVFLVLRIGFIGIPWSYLVSNLICAVLLLWRFAPGFFTSVIRSGWWLVPCAASAVVCGGVSARLLVSGGKVPQIFQLLAGALPFMATYLAASLILAPKHYRDRLFDSARLMFFPGRQTGSGMRDEAGGIRRCSVIPHPESIGCAATED